MTELEFLQGHLRNPGKRAACFFFRDKVKYNYLSILENFKVEIVLTMNSRYLVSRNSWRCLSNPDNPNQNGYMCRRRTKPDH